MTQPERKHLTEAAEHLGAAAGSLRQFSISHVGGGGLDEAKRTLNLVGEIEDKRTNVEQILKRLAADDEAAAAAAKKASQPK